ncbi:hypothetical protein E4U55_004353 [Claviceps digitariae]|nr:hypothetical protein E4U55_004353 [Claviceps digitariae]
MALVSNFHGCYVMMKLEERSKVNRDPVKDRLQPVADAKGYPVCPSKRRGDIVSLRLRKRGKSEKKKCAISKTMTGGRLSAEKSS